MTLSYRAGFLLLPLLLACSECDPPGGQPVAPTEETCDAVSGCAGYQSCCESDQDGIGSCHYVDPSGATVAQLPAACTSTSSSPEDASAGTDAGDASTAPSGPTTLATGTAPWIALDSTSVYWVDPTANAIMRAPLGGGTAATFAAGYGTVSGALTVADGTVYWIAGGVLLSQSAADDAGGVTTLATTSATAATGQQLRVFGGFAYWDDNEVGSDDYYHGTFWSLTLSEVGEGGLGAPYALFSPGQQISAWTADAQNLYWMNGGTSAGEYLDGALLQLSLASGQTLTLADRTTFPTPYDFVPASVAATNGTVFWSIEDLSNSPGGNVDSVSAGGAGATQRATFGGTARVLAADAQNVYWVNGTSLMKMGVSGGAPYLLASLPEDAQSVAVDGTSVYLGTQSGVLKVSPK